MSDAAQSGQPPAVQSPTGQPPAAIEIAATREDFIKRFFAVALSVGIVSQLNRVVFRDDNFRAHSFIWSSAAAQWKELLLLLISFVIVLSSWEGYLRAIKRIPLNDAPRFYIDITLVFCYVIMTFLIKAYDSWFGIHVVIFLLYFLWDILRAGLPEYKRQMEIEPKPVSERSMTITIVWFIYMLALFLFKNCGPSFDDGPGFSALAIAALAGVILYRTDKVKRWSWRAKATFGITPLALLGLFAYAGHFSLK